MIALLLAAIWARAAPADVGIDAGRLAAMEAAAAQGAFPRLGSVLIARHGKLVYEKYFEGDAATLRNTRSATKSITSMLVGIAHVDPAAKVLELLPERAARLVDKDPRKQRITVEDLLTMSSPLECDDWNDASRGNEDRMYLIEDWAQFILELPIRGRMHVGEQPEAPPHGRWFSYCTGGAFLLGQIVGKVTGQRADRFAREKLFAPLGIERAEWVYSPLGEPQTGGGLQLSSLDLLKLAQLYLDGGTWGGARVVDERWVRASGEPHARIDASMEYGYLFWLRSFGGRWPTVYMNGNGGNKVVYVPSLDLAAVVTTTNFNAKDMHVVTDKLLTDYILAAVRDSK